MSVGTLTCADIFSQLTRQRPLAWTQLLRNPIADRAHEYPLAHSMVTDSSAASSAWGSGSRVVNGAVNVLPDGKLLTPLYALFTDAGWKTGLVTTAEITHATPAGFAVAVRSRGNSDAIATQYLERKIDVLLGGGNPFFDPKRRKDKRDLRADFAKAGYAVVLDKAALAQAPTDTRLLGTFADGHLPYTIDHRADAKLREKYRPSPSSPAPRWRGWSAARSSSCRWKARDRPRGTQFRRGCRHPRPARPGRSARGLPRIPEAPPGYAARRHHRSRQLEPRPERHGRRLPQQLAAVRLARGGEDVLPRNPEAPRKGG